MTREYYINDAGAQVDVLARSAFLRYREALGETVTIPEGLYPGDYLKPAGAALAQKYGGSLRDRPESEWLAPVRDAAIDAMMEMIRDDLAALNITHEVFFSERSLHDSSMVRPMLKQRLRILAPRVWSMKDVCLRPRASFPTIGKIASRPCSAPHPSATTSTGP